MQERWHLELSKFFSILHLRKNDFVPLLALALFIVKKWIVIGG